LLPWCVRSRELLALSLSSLANEAALFLVAPTIDYRYSIWTVVASVMTAMIVIARRAQGPASR
jgi:hypothetical protein